MDCHGCLWKIVNLIAVKIADGRFAEDRTETKLLKAGFFTCQLPRLMLRRFLDMDELFFFY